MPISKGQIERILYRLLTAVAAAAAVLGVWFTSAGAAELTLEVALERAVSHHPLAVAAAEAEKAAQQAWRKALAPFTVQVDLSASPLFSRGQSRRTGGNDLLPASSQSEVRLVTELATTFGLSSSATLSHRGVDSDAAASDTSSTSLTLRADAGLDPASNIYHPSRLNLAALYSQLAKAAWDRMLQERQALLTVLETYWKLELDAERLALQRQAAEEKQSIYDQTVEKQAQGAATAADVLNALIDLRQTTAALQRSEIDYKNRLASFAADIGWPDDPEALPTLVPSGGARMDELTTFDKSQMETAAVQASLLLKKKQLDLEISQLRLTAAKAALWPDITLSATYSIPDLADATAAPWSYSLNVSMPVLDGGSRRLTLQERQEDYKKALEAVEIAEKNTARTMQARMESWKQEQLDVEIAALKLEQARMNEETRLIQYRQGSIGELQYQAACRTRRLAELDLQEAVNSRRLVELDIILLAGGAPIAAGIPLAP